MDSYVQNPFSRITSFVTIFKADQECVLGVLGVPFWLIGVDIKGCSREAISSASCSASS
jgi:hypothetical protein